MTGKLTALVYSIPSLSVGLGAPPAGAGGGVARSSRSPTKVHHTRPPLPDNPTLSCGLADGSSHLRGSTRGMHTTARGAGPPAGHADGGDLLSQLMMLAPSMENPRLGLCSHMPGAQVVAGI